MLKSYYWCYNLIKFVSYIEFICQFNNTWTLDIMNLIFTHSELLLHSKYICSYSPEILQMQYSLHTDLLSRYRFECRYWQLLYRFQDDIPHGIKGNLPRRNIFIVLKEYLSWLTTWKKTLRCILKNACKTGFIVRVRNTHMNAYWSKFPNTLKTFLHIFWCSSSINFFSFGWLFVFVSCFIYSKQSNTKYKDGYLHLLGLI